MLDEFFFVDAVIRYALITVLNIDMNYDKLLTISFKRYKDLVKHKTSLFLSLSPSIEMKMAFWCAIDWPTDIK